MKNRSKFSDYPVLIDTEKKTYIFFLVLFSIAFIIFFAFFNKETKKTIDGEIKPNTILFYNK